jgi:hypothetical protein
MMADHSIDVPYTPGMDYGMGVSFLDGTIAGKTVAPGVVAGPTGAVGQVVRYTLTIIKSFEDLFSSLGISVSASGHFGLFKASGKFAYATESKFNSQATFLLARCVVENAFSQAADAALTPDGDGYRLLQQGKTDVFQQRYGDGFVRGLQTGGEYFAVISIISSDREEQESLAASFSAQYGGLFASVSVSAELSEQTKARMSRSEVQVSTYQRGGVGDQTSITEDIAKVMARLQAFPEQVRLNPVPYAAQLARYTTLALPDGPNPLDIAAQKQALEEYAATQLKLMTLRNDLEFVQLHPDYYVDPPSAAELNAWQDMLTDELNNVTRQASICADTPKGGCPAIAFKLPDGYRPPQRKATNAIDVYASGYSFPSAVFMRTIETPPEFQVTTRLVTNFTDVRAPGQAHYIGLGLYADSINRIVALYKGVDDGSNALTTLAYGLVWDGANPISIGVGRVDYPDDEVYLRLAKQNGQVADVSYSRDGNEWKTLGRFLSLVELGFPEGTPLRLVLIAYSTWQQSVAGTFHDTNVVPI